VGAAIWSSKTWRALRTGIRAAGTWSMRTVRPAGVLVIVAASVGLTVGLGLGWVEWIVAGTAALVLLVLSLPFLFGARSYDVDLKLGHERVVAGNGVSAQVTVRNTGGRVALPGRIDVPVGDGLVEFGVPLLRPDQETVHTLDIPP